MKNTLLVTLIILLSLFAVFPSFHLGLYGDDWLEIWRSIYTLGPKSHGLINYLTYFYSRYGSFDLIMNLLVSFVGFKSVYFYITAYILKLVASFSFFPLIFYITKNRVASLMAVLFFACTAVGLDATNWVFNMPVYLSIALLNYFFLFYVKSTLAQDRKQFFIGIIFLFFAIVIASVRMTGFLPLVIIVELFWIIRKPQLKLAKFHAINLLIFISFFLLLAWSGQASANYGGRVGYELIGSLGDVQGILGGGISTSGKMLADSKSKLLLSPLIILGGVILPVEQSLGNELILIVIAGIFLILAVTVILKNYRDDLLVTSLILSLSWMVVSFIFAWFKDPSTILSFSHRYLIVSVAGFTIFLGLILDIFKKAQKALLAILFILVAVNIYSSRGYFQSQVDHIHGAQFTESIWSQIPRIPQIGNSKDPIIFYFTGEPKQIIYGAIAFGFPVHMALDYKIDDFSKMPNGVDTWEQLISVVKDGKPLAAFGLKVQPVPIENIYSFNLQDQKLVDQTTKIRMEIQKNP